MNCDEFQVAVLMDRFEYKVEKYYGISGVEFYRSKRTNLMQLYRVSQEKCARLRESVPYVKVYRYNPKHLYPKLNGYGDNGQRKVRSSCGSMYCTCSADALHVHCACPSFVYRQLSHAATRISTCIVLGTLRTTTALLRVFM
jgi:hypothetical protein